MVHIFQNKVVDITCDWLFGHEFHKPALSTQS